MARARRAVGPTESRVSTALLTHTSAGVCARARVMCVMCVSGACVPRVSHAGSWTGIAVQNRQATRAARNAPQEFRCRLTVCDIQRDRETERQRDRETERQMQTDGMRYTIHNMLYFNTL